MFANKQNKNSEQLLVEWTYYEDGVCEDPEQASFYGACYKDTGSHVDMKQAVMDSLTNFVTGINVNEGASAFITVA